MEGKCKRCRKPFTFHWPATRKSYCSRACSLRDFYARNRERLNKQAVANYWKNPEGYRAIKRRWNNSEEGMKNRLQWYREHATESYARMKARGGIALIISRVTSRRRLVRSGRPMVCIYKPPHSGRLECHHKDHDPHNKRLSNLVWVCHGHHALRHRLRRAKLNGSARTVQRS